MKFHFKKKFRFFSRAISHHDSSKKKMFCKTMSGPNFHFFFKQKKITIKQMLVTVFWLAISFRIPFKSEIDPRKTKKIQSNYFIENFLEASINKNRFHFSWSKTIRFHPGKEVERINHRNVWCGGRRKTPYECGGIGHDLWRHTAGWPDLLTDWLPNGCVYTDIPGT